MSSTLRTTVRWTLSGGTLLDSLSESLSSTITTPTKLAVVVTAATTPGTAITQLASGYTGTVLIKNLDAAIVVTLTVDAEIVSVLNAEEFVILNRIPTGTWKVTSASGSPQVLVQGVTY